jgi:hypothetical protein
MFLAALMTVVASLSSIDSWAGEERIVLRDYLNQQWTNELLAYPIVAAEGE